MPGNSIKTGIEYMSNFHIAFLSQHAGRNLNILEVSVDGLTVIVEDCDTNTIDVYKKIDDVYVWLGYK